MSASCSKQGSLPSQPAQLLPSEQGFVVITVAFGDVERGVKFSRKDDPAVIEEAICLELGIPVGSLILLRDEEDYVVPVSGHLSPGAYTVFVVPSLSPHGPPTDPPRTPPIQ